MEFLQRDIRELSYPGETFDLIVSSITVHHLTADERNHSCSQISSAG